MKRKCNASANPTRTLPPRIVGDLEGGGGGGGGGGVNILLLQTKSRPVCLAPGQPCGRDLSLV